MSKETTANLNTQQIKAVEATDGPVLILAGAGSGKTRVLTYKASISSRKKAFRAKYILTTFTNRLQMRLRESWTLLATN